MSLFRRFHDRLGTAGLIVAILAMVLALTGGALAASGKLTSKQKKEVEKIAKKYAGKPGATGPQGAAGAAGPAGPAGPKGDAGDDGAPGDDGTDGKSVTTGTALPADCPEVGGATVEVVGEPATKKKICNGKEGSPWTLGGTLPEGETITGSWGWGGKEGPNVVTLSVPIPLDGAVTLQYVKLADSLPAGCPGQVSGKPTAEPGFLCVYEKQLAGTLSYSFADPTTTAGAPPTTASPSGVLMLGNCASAICLAWGTWAVTAPEAA
jgi:hypothetical protein